MASKAKDTRYFLWFYTDKLTVVPVSLVVSFVIAYYLDRVRFMHGFIRALYFLPFLTTAAAMGWVWRWLCWRCPTCFSRWCCRAVPTACSASRRT